MIEDLLKKRNMTKYRLAAEAGIPYVMLDDICNGKTRLEECPAEFVSKLAKALGVPMELLAAEEIRQAERERSYEYGSIHAAEITDGVITKEHADYLRGKYL